jgi:hypothetical protein
VERAGGGGNRVVDEEVRAAEAAVALAALRVEDPELRPPPRWAEPVPGDGHLGLLADDVASEPDPRPAGKLETETRRLGNGRREARGEAGRLESHEQRLRAAGEGRETAEPVRDAGGGRPGIRARRQVDDEEVDRAAGQERPGDRQALVERLRGEDDEPVQPDAAGDRLDRVERSGEVQPGNDRAVSLRLRGEPQGKGRLAGAGVAAEGDAGAARQAARPEDRVERREAGPDDPLDGPASGSRLLLGQRRRRQRPDDPRSCRAPACLEGRQCSRHVRGERRHRATIEQTFYIDQYR